MCELTLVGVRSGSQVISLPTNNVLMITLVSCQSPTLQTVASSLCVCPCEDSMVPEWCCGGLNNYFYTKMVQVQSIQSINGIESRVCVDVH